MEDVILFHGSRNGINGEIQPISRNRCDFGKGFYMGSIEKQAKGLVVSSESPTIYQLKFKLSEIPENKILILDGENWLYTVLANRKLSTQFSESVLAKHWLNETNKYDVIIGSIADDKMRDAINAFSQNLITDTNLTRCLQSVDYGTQYVAKTEFACGKIEILSATHLDKKEKKEIEHYNLQKRIETSESLAQINAAHYNDGHILSEIIQNANKNKMNQRYMASTQLTQNIRNSLDTSMNTPEM